MRRTRPSMLVVALVATCLVATAPPASAKSAYKVRKFREITTQFYFGSSTILFPVTSPTAGGRGVGNVLYATSNLLERGRLAGKAIGTCLTVSDGNSVVTGSEGKGMGTPVVKATGGHNIAQCSYTLKLRGGTIVAQGEFDQTAFEGGCAAMPDAIRCAGSTEHLAIVGGTKKFVGARGELLLRQREYPDVVDMTMRRLR